MYFVQQLFFIHIIIFTKFGQNYSLYSYEYFLILFLPLSNQFFVAIFYALARSGDIINSDFYTYDFTFLFIKFSFQFCIFSCIRTRCSLLFIFFLKLILLFMIKIFIFQFDSNLYTIFCAFANSGKITTFYLK